MKPISNESLSPADPHLPSALEENPNITILSQEKPGAQAAPTPEDITSPRPFGLCKGEFTVPNDFNDPLPEIEAEIYGS